MAKSQNRQYYKEMMSIGIPVTLQSIFQASYSLVDQIMVGKLGEVSIAGSGLGGKFSSLVAFTLSSIAAVASILIAQYHGHHDREGLSKSFFSCSYIAGIIMLIFSIPSFWVPSFIISLYTDDSSVISAGAEYLQIISVSFIPMTVTLIVSSFFRSTEQSRYPMYASASSLILNLIFNYMFIFGKLGMPQLGLNGAAIGTLLARSVEALLLIFWLIMKNRGPESLLVPAFRVNSMFYKKISIIVWPIVINEFSWSFGENIYASIYGRLGTDALAAMTLTGPLQSMFIGMFSGISSAALVMVGKRLGNDKEQDAFTISKLLMKVGLGGGILIGIMLALLIPLYTKLFNVDSNVAELTRYITYALAIVISAKITNMILGGGILRSGGNTRFTLITDLIGTWVLGVPLGLLTAYVFHLPIYLVYIILSLEEVARVIMGLHIFRSRKWMNNVTRQ